MTCDDDKPIALNTPNSQAFLELFEEKKIISEKNKTIIVIIKPLEYWQ